MPKRSGYGSQFGDVHTDRLLFALDWASDQLPNPPMARQGTRLVSQRGWTDNFVFGAVQGIFDQATEELLRSRELERASAYIHMVAELRAAFARIQADPDRDKFETPDFLIPQYEETLRLFAEIGARNPVLGEFHGIPKTLIDTTRMTNEEVYAVAGRFVSTAVPDLT